MTNYQKRKEKNDEYRSKIMRFTFQLSLGDTEVREWFERQPEKGAYLKDLILRDKAERLGYREQKSAEPDKAGDYEIIQSIRMGGRVLLMGFNPKDETYMTCYQQYNFLGETMYPEALACKSYLEIAETFLNRLQAQVEKVKAFRVHRGRSHRLKLNSFFHPNTPTTGVFFRICEAVALMRRSSTTVSNMASFTRTLYIIIAYLWATETTNPPMARCEGRFRIAPLPVKPLAATNGFPLPCLAAPVVKRSACLKRPSTHFLI